MNRNGDVLQFGVVTPRKRRVSRNDSIDALASMEDESRLARGV